MGEMQAWAAGLCAAALGCTLLQMLAPKNGNGKLFRLIMAAFFICAMVSPLFSADALMELPAWSPQQQQERLQREFKQQVLEQVDETLLAVVNSTLVNYHMQAESAEAETETLADGTLSIVKVTVYVDRDKVDSTIAVKQILERRLEMETVVQYSD